MTAAVIILLLLLICIPVLITANKTVYPYAMGPPDTLPPELKSMDWTLLMQKRDEWTPTEAGLPAPHEIVLTWGPEGYGLAHCKQHRPYVYQWRGVLLTPVEEGGGITAAQVTHWRLIPKPPRPH